MLWRIWETADNLVICTVIELVGCCLFSAGAVETNRKHVELSEGDPWIIDQQRTTSKPIETRLYARNDLGTPTVIGLYYE